MRAYRLVENRPFWSLFLLLGTIGALCWAPSAGRTANSASQTIRGWVQGSGWGWQWGPHDEVGALNALTQQTVLEALRGVQQGEIFDLGVTYDRNSFKWPGHSPGEIMSFRSPVGEKSQQDHPFMTPEANPHGLGWHSCALFMNDNVGTQIDTLGHITLGEDNHWYNGFVEREHGGDFGIRRCDATTIPPIIAQAVLLDVAAMRGVDALPSGYAITPHDIDATLRRQKTELRPGVVVLVRTGAMRYWGKNGADAAKIGEHDSAGISLETARYLVEQHGAVMIGSDTSGLECNPPTSRDQGVFPVHRYLLVEQGVHIGEFHYLEDLAKNQAYEFCYIAMTNKIAGATAGFAMRPIAVR